MAMTLAESATLSTNTLARGVMESFHIESPVFDRLPLMDIEGNAYAYNAEGTLPGVAFRGVNEAYVESTGTFVQRTETLSILGGDADVDRFIVRTRSNLADQRALQTAAKVKAASYKFQDTFINGDITVDPKGFDGLKKRLTGDQVVDVDANGIGPVEGGEEFFDGLDNLFAQIDGGPTVAYTNRRILQRIKSSGRRLGGFDMVKSDITGKREVMWQGTPILDIGNRADGSMILPQNEVQGTAKDCSSVYAVKFGRDESEQAVTGLTNGGVHVEDLGQLQEKPVYRTRLELYVGMATFGGRCAARLRGVRNA